MRFPANCVVVTAAAALLGHRPRSLRNRSGRLHFYWQTSSGEAFEFYTKGASRRPYWRNALTFGEIRRAPALDETVTETKAMKATEIITLGEREAARLEQENDHAAAVIMRELIAQLRYAMQGPVIVVRPGGGGGTDESDRSDHDRYALRPRKIV